MWKRGKGSGAERLLEEMLAENFPDFVKEINL